MSVVTRINSDDVAILLIDHQSGLFQTVKDIDVTSLRNNVTTLAKIAAIENIPVITTASEPNGPNGPLMPEIHKYAPHAVYVPRNGEINAWDTPAFVEAVKKTGKKKLIIGGVLTSVCVAFPSISAVTEGYEVFAVIDASGDMSPLSSQTTIARLSLAGVVPITTTAVCSEIQKTWNRQDALQFAEAYSAVMPNYQAVIESFLKAESVGTSK
jgi:nicotinamidase-related amidase